MEIDQTKKCGVKISIISQMDFEDLKAILNAIREIGYKITSVENGNHVAIKGKKE